VPDGTALDAAVALAETIAAFPWACVVSDRRSVYDGLGLGLEDALANEDRLGTETILAADFAEGVARFTNRPVPGM
jgi:enoyl-CoA hydratase